jgi:phosphopantetheinyl transferase
MKKIEVALLRHSDFSLLELQNYARQILPQNLGRKFGKSMERQRSFWAGRAILAKILGRHAGFSYMVRPDDFYGYLRLYDGKNGNPVPLFANISHTDEIAVAAVASSPVGIDVESKLRSGDKVMKRVATERELKQLHQFFLKKDAQRVPAPIALWSGKEAFSKALGLGMRFGFKAFEIDLSVPPPWPGQTNLKGPLEVKRPCIDILSYEKYFITVCSGEEGFAIDFQTFQESESFLAS